MDNKRLALTLKFGGCWSKVKNENRKKYIWKRKIKKIIKVNKDIFCFSLLIQDIEGTCSWLKGHGYTLYFHISGTPTKNYMFISNDIDMMELVRLSNESSQAKVVIVT